MRVTNVLGEACDDTASTKGDNYAKESLDSLAP